MVLIISVAVCSSEGNGNKSLAREEYVVAESEFDRVNWFFIQGA